ncbi:hypothetical protein JAO29_09380 [Edaphobacter sp. HDX4]|uniref:hypothetical protein n=1 Tax=Edaphobacter sp. HDX4 TaxID=2794064 RepID=UPI002FE5A9C8
MVRERDFSEDKAQERQQKTLSVRISDALHERLERVRDVLSVKAGTRVSTSEVAKQLLESADEERLELIELMQKPTDALTRIREKHSQGLQLSKSEWTCVAYYVHQGMEWFSGNNSHISPDSYIAVIKAFLAVYKLLPKSEFRHQDYYLGNLDHRDAGEIGPITSEDVLKAAARCIQKVETATKKPYTPLYAGRNLYAVLDGERITDTPALNDALAPFWPALWRLAARGHFRVCKMPLRASRNPGEEHFEDKSYLPPVSEPVSDGQFSLSFSTLDGTDLSVLLVFPGTRGAMYPISPYPMIARFRAMLFGLRADQELQHWDSETFFAYTSRNGDEIDASFRAKDNGITFGFSPQEWSALKRLFTKAWNTPEISRTWDKLTQEYGEL